MSSMMPRRITAAELKANCARLLGEVQQHREGIVITKRGKPVAKLVPFGDQRPSFIGSMSGTMEILGEIVAPIDVHWQDD